MRSKPLLLSLLIATSHSFAQQIPQVENVFLIPKVVNYEIGATNADSVIKRISWYKGQVPCENWKSRRTPSMYYSAELIRNPKADLSTDWVKQCQAAFIPGYRILVTASEGYNTCILKNVEMVFDNNLLMRFTADVDTNFYKAMYRYNGDATRVVTKNDSIPNPYGLKEKMILKRKEYIWKVGTLKAEVVVADMLNAQHKKYTAAVYTIMDSVKNAVYLKKVAQQKEVFARQ